MRKSARDRLRLVRAVGKVDAYVDRLASLGDVARKPIGEAVGGALNRIE